LQSAGFPLLLCLLCLLCLLLSCLECERTRERFPFVGRRNDGKGIVQIPNRDTVLFSCLFSKTEPAHPTLTASCEMR